MKTQFEAAARQAERAMAAVGTEHEMAEMMKVLRYQEEIQIALTHRALNRVAEAPLRNNERLPLRAEGDDFGRIEARIPKSLFFGLMHQKNFGYDGFTSDEGMRDLLKAHPCCRVTTVSGKVQVGYGSKKPRRRKSGCHFGRGTFVPAI